MIYQNYHKLLVANRGEIASRVIRSAHDMGISCVAIYVEADTNSPYVKMADEAVKISDSYLNSKEIIKAALDTGAEAIHPGYGFLSENAKFSREVLKAGLLWVGPSARVITSMGDKLKAKDLAEKDFAKGGEVKGYMGGGSVHKNKSKMITKRGWGASRKT